ncbi:MAG: hypothetical protein V2I26_00155, partial [Halieaceae bacterium]|nr:hypothetical protein [Halieaceae bacterium]
QSPEFALDRREDQVTGGGSCIGSRGTMGIGMLGNRSRTEVMKGEKRLGQGLIAQGKGLAAC